MADSLDQQHIDAGFALLRADVGPPPLQVYPDATGFVPDVMTPPYVRVYAWLERPESGEGRSLEGSTAEWVTHWNCHSVGLTDAEAVAVAMRVDRALLDKRPSISGRSVKRITQELSSPPDRQTQTGSTIYDLVIQYRMSTWG